ncbi:MAG: oligosaccharide flippase family protein [Bacteroidales bacterium]|nr:oligosaccharide flippase family protein [Bacteroidales bacterium]
MSQNRTKLFIENFLAYGTINALDKIVPLIMLPIVTRLITDTGDYGRFEMFNTIVGFGGTFAVLGMYDAMFREYFEKNSLEYKKIVTSTSARIVFFSALLVTFLLIIFSRITSQLFLNTSENWGIVIMAAMGTFLSANRAIISAPTRIKNQRSIYVFSGISYSFIYYLLAIIFIKLGFNYYGLIYGNLIASCYLLLFFYILNRKDFNLNLFNIKVAKELLKIGIPLVPCFVIYWAFNSMDKIMISHIIGINAVGIYSIGAKVASVSMFIYAAFAGGWQYFAFSTMKDKDQVELTSKVFEYLGVLSVIAFCVATIFDDFVFTLFFTGDYVLGVLVFPYLFLSPLMLMLFQTAGNQLLVVKKSYLSTLTLAIGLIFNLVLNYYFIPIYGIKGAALATLVGYACSVVSIVILTIKMQLLHIKPRFINLAIIIILFIVKLFWFDDIWSNLFAILIVFISFALYYKDVMQVFKTRTRLKSRITI